MLWGASLGAGSEAGKRHSEKGEAVRSAVYATQKLITSFEKKTGSADCKDYTKADFNNFFSMIKFLITKAMSCFDLAVKWGQDAVTTVKESIIVKENSKKSDVLSCASVTAEKMGASEHKIVSVSGFAGGLGLSGNACGCKEIIEDLSSY